MAQICVAVNTYVEIDDADWAEFSCFGINVGAGGYAKYKLRGQTKYLHVEIYRNVDPTYQGIVDHKDLDKLNCRRDNLRPATKSQNVANGTRKPGSSGVIGVYYIPDRDQYQAQIRVGGQLKHIGYYSTLAEATEARRVAAINLQGQFAKERRECD